MQIIQGLGAPGAAQNYHVIRPYGATGAASLGTDWWWVGCRNNNCCCSCSVVLATVIATGNCCCPRTWQLPEVPSCAIMPQIYGEQMSMVQYFPLGLFFVSVFPSLEAPGGVRSGPFGVLVVLACNFFCSTWVFKALLMCL